MYSDKDYSYSGNIPKEMLHQKDKIFDDWEIPPWNLLIHKDKLLGEGEFGKVYLASWHHRQTHKHKYLNYGGEISIKMKVGRLAGR